jgi:hypothetical protein
MNDLDHAHFVYALPIWTLGTWAILLILSGCILGMKRKLDRHDDLLREMLCKQDAYFGLPKLDAEAIRMRDMEVRRIRDDIIRHPELKDDDDSSIE